MDFFGGSVFSVILTLILVAVTYAIYMIVVHPFLSPFYKIPGEPFGNILFGNMRELQNNKNFSFELFNKWAKKHGRIYRFYTFLHKPRIVISDPDFIKYVTVTNVKNYKKPVVSFSYFPFIVGKHGLLLSEGELHHVHQKLISPAFRISFLKTLTKVFQHCATEVVEFWNDHFEKSKNLVEVNVHSDLSRMTLDALGQSVFSYKFDCIRQNSYISETYTKLLEVTGLRGILQFLPYNYYFPTNTNSEFWKNHATIYKVVDDVITDKKEKLKNKDSESATDLLDILIMAKNDVSGHGLSDTELREEVMTFILAGHETTAVAMSWTLLLLAEHLDIQAKVREEIIKVLPTKNEPITWEHLENLKYLNCVINESMRIYSPVPVVVRQAINDDEIGGYVIPKGLIVVLYPLIIHRSEEYWPDPMTFNPDRFQEEPRPFTFLPFLSGPRMCIGYRFAVAEMKMTLAMLLREFEFTKNKDYNFQPRQLITVRPNPPLKLNISKIL